MAATTKISTLSEKIILKRDKGNQFNYTWADSDALPLLSCVKKFRKFTKAKRLCFVAIGCTRPEKNLNIFCFAQKIIKK